MVKLKTFLINQLGSNHFFCNPDHALKYAAAHFAVGKPSSVQNKGNTKSPQKRGRPRKLQNIRDEDGDVDVDDSQLQHLTESQDNVDSDSGSDEEGNDL